mmetsp:Transcript_630/g.1396  ORF Transcript_630/g.1396 Transcript_630/m.1396 type:complete len:276 (+) Transcript_630:141-968(+)
MSHPAHQINQTSCRIVDGDYDEAITSLTNTLKTLKLVLSGDAKIDFQDEMDGEQDDLKTSDSFEYDFYSSPTSSSFLKTAVVAQGCHNNSSIGCTHNRESFEESCHDNRCDFVFGPQHQHQVTIFRDPIIVRGDNFRAQLDGQLCEELSYVAIYNLALSHHLKSVELELSSKQNLKRAYLHKALSLYEHSHQILTKQTINVGVPVIHSMALVSNLGQIHHTLGDHYKAEMCLQYLLSTIMYVIDCGKVNTLGNSIDGFFNMILPLISQDDPAPAA